MKLVVIAIGKYVKRSLGALILAGAVIYCADWLVLRHKITTDGEAYDDVLVHYRYAVHLKNRQIEQRNEQPQPVECVNSLFSHYGEPPCWYLRRHANDNQDLDGGPWHFWSDDRP